MDTLKSIKTYQFANLGDFRDWLNQFKETDLSAVAPNDGNWISVSWIEETLSDGSTVTNVHINCYG